MCLGGDVAAGGASRGAAGGVPPPPLFSCFKPVCGGVAGLHAQRWLKTELLDVVDGQDS